MANIFVIDSAGGISGSIQHLADGASYLIAGEGISIVSQSNGQILIATSGSAGIPNVNTSGSNLSFYTADPVPQASAITKVGPMIELTNCTTVWSGQGDPPGRLVIDTNFGTVASKVDELRVAVNAINACISQLSGGIGITA